LRVRADARAPASAATAGEALTPDESRGSECFDATYRGDAAGRVIAELVVPAANAPAVNHVEVSASRRITPLAMWPVLLMLAGFVIIVSAPRVPRPSSGEGVDDVPGALSIPQFVPLGGVVPPDAIEPGMPPPPFAPLGEDPSTATLAPALPAITGPAQMPATFADFVLGRPAPVKWRFSALLAIGAYIGVFVAMNAIVVVFALLTGGAEAMLRTGFGVAFSMFVNHGLMIVTAFWFLGALTARDRREALGLVPAKPLEILRAIGIAFVLVVIALVTTKFIKNAHETEMGQLVERMPVRYAIGFGALLAPFSEELFFRGVFYGAFAKHSKWFGVLGSAVLFTAAHYLQLAGAALGLVPIAAVGLANGWLRAQSGGITQPWIVHTVYNLTLSLGLYFA
jgi:membrane protease YdiL (CAAX protease family)